MSVYQFVNLSLFSQQMENKKNRANLAIYPTHYQLIVFINTLNAHALFPPFSYLPKDNKLHSSQS